jgi:hypothetical protein
MMLVALAASLLLVNYIRKYKGDNYKRGDSPDGASGGSSGGSLNRSINSLDKTDRNSMEKSDRKSDEREETTAQLAETREDHGVSELWRRISKQERSRSDGRRRQGPPV